MWAYHRGAQARLTRRADCQRTSAGSSATRQGNGQQQAEYGVTLARQGTWHTVRHVLRVRAACTSTEALRSVHESHWQMKIRHLPACWRSVRRVPQSVVRTVLCPGTVLYPGTVYLHIRECSAKPCLDNHGHPGSMYDFTVFYSPVPAGKQGWS